VTCGQNINKGAVIGTVGKSGNTIKPELHFQVLSVKNFVDPWSVLPLPEKCDNVRYIVQSGDTLLRIATLFDISAESIRVANNFPNDTLTPGTELTIPLCH
jgi:murein DD-endopeptidase MepM/ murein hydrolase activator NlpD